VAAQLYRLVNVASNAEAGFVELDDPHLSVAEAPANDAPGLRLVKPLPARQLTRECQRLRIEAALAVDKALRAIGFSYAQCARAWGESTTQAYYRRKGLRPLCVEHLFALPPRPREAALSALARGKRAA
jgi:hypothetical protein